MRNLLIILILIFPSLMLSQSATKWQQKNADKISSYVIEKMDLNTKDAAFFSKAQLAQIVENANNIKESGASTEEEKKAVYRIGYTNIKAKLEKRFGKKLAADLLKAANEARSQKLITIDFYKRRIFPPFFYL